MMRSRSAASIRFGISVLILLGSPLMASFHQVRMVQVYGGDVSHPDAQYVELQLCAAGSNMVAGCTINFYDAAGVEIGLPPTFPANLPIGVTQSAILIATSTAQTLFGITADLQMPARLHVDGGKVCFGLGASVVDCFGWGSYAALPDATIGTPFDVGAGLPFGDAATRDLSPGTPNILDCASDDTNQSADDFDPGVPLPRNNAAQAGFLNQNHIFVHGFEAGATGGWSFVLP